MLDPFTSLGVAGNVLQLITFAHGLVSESKRIHASVNGLLIENREAKEVAEDLQKLTATLSDSQQKWIPADESGVWDEDESELRNLCDNCYAISTELVFRLQRLQVDERFGKRSRIKSFKQALVTVWQKDALENVAQRLERYQDQLNTRILVHLLKDAQLSKTRQTAQYEALGQRAQDSIDVVLDSRDQVTALLHMQSQQLHGIVAAHGQTRDMLSALNVGASQDSLVRSASPASGYSLHKAVKLGNAPEVKRLLRGNSFDVNRRDESGYGALHLSPTAELTKQLLRNGADIHLEDAGGRTALHCAVLKRRMDVVRTLLEWNIDKTLEDDHGKPAAFYARDCPAVQWILDYGPDVDARAKDWHNNTGLIAMVNLGDMEGIEYFLENGADVNAMCEQTHPQGEKQTALTQAARRGDCDLVELLCANGSDLELPKTKEWPASALMNAVNYGRAEVVALLLRKGASTEAKLESGNNPLAEAAWQGKWDLVPTLVEGGSDIDSRDFYGRTPLIKAAQDGKEEMVEFLLKRGAKLEIATRDNETALHMAAKHAQSGCMKRLLQAGADVHTRNKSGWRPLTRVAAYGSVERVRMLLEHNAPIDAKGIHGNCALAEVAYHGRTEIAQLLLARGASLNIRNDQGHGPLQVACAQGHAKVARLYLEHGADPDLAGYGKTSWTALSSAAEKGHTEVVEALAEHKAKLNAQDSRGWTAMMHAAYHRREGAIRVLINHGADVDRVNNDGYSALMYAAERGHEECVELLVGANANAGLRNRHGRTALSLAIYNGHDHKKGLRQCLERPSEIQKTLRSLQSSREPGEVAQFIIENFE